MAFVPASLTAANSTAIAALKVGPTDGLNLWSLSVKDRYLLQAGAATVDGLNVITANGPVGYQWIRQNLGSEIWREQATWFVNSATGNDENSGATAGTALATINEIIRRWGPSPNIRQGTTITIVGDQNNVNAPVDFDVYTNNGIVLTIQGTPTAVRSGTFTAVTNKNRATNTRWQVTDTGVASWAANIGQRVRITSGPRANAFSRVTAIAGANAAFMSEFVQIDGLGNITSVTPLVNDPYTVERDSVLFLERLTAQSDGAGEILFKQITFSSNEFDLIAQCVQSFIVFQDCSFQGVFEAHSSIGDERLGQSGIVCKGCDFESDTFCNGVLSIQAGQHISHVLNVASGGALFLDNDFVQTGAFGLVCNAGSKVSIGNAGFFNVTGPNNVYNADASGVYVRTGGSCELQDSGLGQFLWGSGNQGFGVSVQAGGKVRANTAPNLTLTGTSGDFRLAGSNTARAFDETAGAYTTARATTWANFAATIAGGGFAGQAHNVSLDAHIVTSIL